MYNFFFSTTPLPYTAKGERRLRDKLEREGRSPEEVGLISPQDPSLTPEKQKQMEAERRAQWRKERLKSLENVRPICHRELKTLCAF